MKHSLIRCLSAAGALAFSLHAAAAAPTGVIRNGDSPGRPILSSVEVPAAKNIIFVSGMVPPALNTDGPASDRDYGSMEVQTMAVLTRIETHLKELGLGMGDIVKAQAFLVADPRTGTVDRDGFNTAFAKFFGTSAQPNKPARSAFVIAGLGSPRMFVEVEVVAVRP
jgi:enamine deaminase RidA (YjgF/YER057c/UK114 family)